jgi:xenotropic and polytropic retrovirus receptor 1
VHRKKLTGSASRGRDVYETELLDEQLAGGDKTDAAAEFFARLDAQLNKVNQFYKCKEKEFLERGGSLRKQMDILAELKAARDGDPSVSSSFTSSGSGQYLPLDQPAVGVRRDSQLCRRVPPGCGLAGGKVT